jgi:GNAT superfamily N-acetyltransferase
MPRNASPPDIRVVPFEERHAAAFRDLNLDWIEEYFVVEEIDRRYLDAPVQAILAAGGAILMVEQEGLPVGCCALLNRGEGVYEVSKMAVDRRLRGRGIGSVLLNEVIRHARAMGTEKLTIISNTVLEPAMRLYRDLGFVEVPLQSQAYARGNIALELTLG